MPTSDQEVSAQDCASSTDGLGRHSDPEIVETVVGLNALAIPPAMSCGGHLDEGRGLLLPWVESAPIDPALDAL